MYLTFPEEWIQPHFALLEALEVTVNLFVQDLLLGNEDILNT